jgi:hypothetical protein
LEPVAAVPFDDNALDALVQAAAAKPGFDELIGEHRQPRLGPGCG